MADNETVPSDIVDRLLPWSVHDELEPYGPNEQLISDAIAEIKQLRAENAELRKSRDGWSGRALWAASKMAASRAMPPDNQSHRDAGRLASLMCRITDDLGWISTWF